MKKLPVTWKYFNVRNTGNSRPLIQWATSEETNASHFELERSENAVVFTSINTVAAAGHSMATNAYAYQEEFLPSGVYYYRIKQVDLDGKFNFTRVVSTIIEESSIIKAYPNPVTDLLNIESEKVLGIVEVFNVAGTRLYTSKQNLNTMSLDMSKFPTGLYTVTTNGKSAKVIKK
ncbi:T9SS type A sorting domain-containing protein [Dyadobacter sp. CY327]|uniref:T9SS type A sorting domain-containing protein n=1 Tax=Dyadobacter sp. CY327 TaxID=2907301 RepID=UPI001F46DE34|nr:T9SS type A sorting domain-containing protein [Dyadobacter sp. CY327]MCE7071954.1 T9SS type A sorting domain-containing protein [Dyadobacter sp. CY327]